ncbi:HPF/RaiA family ribosome-associated protein [Candidatus Woesearchaeota archaeon]|nr:HPF/RaiA family ribosome-associated protein [Candidatus Woesearchaeota archaeon]
MDEAIIEQEVSFEETSEIIQYVGLDQLDDKERETLNKLSTEYHPKVKRLLHNNTSLTIHIKKLRNNSKNEKKRHKYSITVKTVSPTKPFRAASNDWNLNTAIHDAFMNLEKELERVYKKNDIHKNHIKFSTSNKTKKKK